MSERETPLPNPLPTGPLPAALPPAIQQLAQARIAALGAAERARNIAAATQRRVVKRSQKAPQAGIPSVSLEEEIDRAKKLAVRNYFAMLSEPAVTQHIRELLTTADPKGIRDILLGLQGGLLAAGAGDAPGGPAMRITIQNRLPRPPDVDVTPS